jgi:hypothetical protein
MVSAPNVRIHRTGVFAAGAGAGGVAGFFDEAAAFFTRIDFLTGIDVLLRNMDLLSNRSARALLRAGLG